MFFRFPRTRDGIPNAPPSNSASATMKALFASPSECSKSRFQRPLCLNAAWKPTIFTETGSNSSPSERFVAAN